jgi:hypothetical protein
MAFLHGDLLCPPLKMTWKKRQLGGDGQSHFKNKSKEKEVGHY